MSTAMESALRIGYAAVHFPNFYAFENGQALARKEGLAKLVKRMNSTLCEEPNLFSDAAGAEAAAAKLAQEKADLVILDVCCFPEGKAWMRFVELVDAPILLWSRPELMKEGPIGHNSFCGANFINANMARAGRRCRSLFGDVSSKEFQKRLKAAIELLSAAKAARGSRIGLIGNGIVPKFFDLDVSGAERARLEKQWDIRFVNVPLEEVWAVADALPSQKVDAEIEREKKLYKRIAVPEKALRDQAAMFLAVKSHAEKNALASVAIRCWPEFGAKRSLWPCGLIGHLNDSGIPAACEGDPMGALDLLLASKLSKQPACILDIIDFDDAKGTLNVWHCGPGAASCSDANGVELLPHLVDGKGPDGKPAHGHPCIHSMGYKAGKLAVFRTLGAFDDEFLIEGELSESAKHVAGTSGLLGKISCYGKAVTNDELRNQIFSRGIPHHYAAFYRD